MSTHAVKFVDENAAQTSIVYILDDDNKVSSLVSRMVDSAGLVSVPFNHPETCLKQLKTCDAYNTPKIVILDLSLGKTDGIEVLNELRTAKYKGNILLISGKDESALNEIEQMGTSRGLRMLPSLKKPFRKDDLISRLKIELEPVRLASLTSEPASAGSSLERAVSSGGVVLRYQTVADLSSGAVCAAEVVLYENNPSSGFVPLEFSNTASNAAIFHPLSRLLLRTAMKDWLQYLSKCPTPVRLFTKLPLSVVAVNNFLTLVREVLSPHPQFPGLIVEVDDWKLLETRTIREAVARLKLYNVELAVADIGAVYDAIAKSNGFPFAEFRLNADFVANCALNETKRELCQNAIKLAHDVGAMVCATGVATNDELETLVQLKCDKAQGRFLGGPQPAEFFRTKLLSSTGSSGGDANSADAEFEWPEAVGHR